jgi:hypothetical protein
MVFALVGLFLIAFACAPLRISAEDEVEYRFRLAIANVIDSYFFSHFLCAIQLLSLGFLDVVLQNVPQLRGAPLTVVLSNLENCGFFHSKENKILEKWLIFQPIYCGNR